MLWDDIETISRWLCFTFSAEIHLKKLHSWLFYTSICSMKSTASRQTQINTKNSSMSFVWIDGVVCVWLLREHLLINDQKYVVSFRCLSLTHNFTTRWIRWSMLPNVVACLIHSSDFIHKFIKEGERERKMPCRVFVPVFYVFFHIHTTSVGALEEKKSHYVARLHDLKIYEWNSRCCYYFQLHSQLKLDEEKNKKKH